MFIFLTFRTIFVHNMFSSCCELLEKIYLYLPNKEYTEWRLITCSSDQTTNPDITNPVFFTKIILLTVMPYWYFLWSLAKNSFWVNKKPQQISWKRVRMNVYGTFWNQIKRVKLSEKIRNYCSSLRDKWYFVTNIVLTYCEKKIVLVIEKNFWNSRLKAENL